MLCRIRQEGCRVFASHDSLLPCHVVQRIGGTQTVVHTEELLRRFPVIAVRRLVPLADTAHRGDIAERTSLVLILARTALRGSKETSYRLHGFVRLAVLPALLIVLLRRRRGTRRQACCNVRCHADRHASHRHYESSVAHALFRFCLGFDLR